MKRILVVEDEPVIRKALQQLLERNQYVVRSVGSVPEAIEENLSSFNLILADLRLPGAEGTDLIAIAAPVPVLIMTSHASVRSAVQSMKLGAVDYISKPFDHDELLLVIERSLRHNRLHAQNTAMKRDLLRIFSHNEVITNSPAMKHIIDALTTLNDQDRHILLHGERGTGKELLARIAHQTGDRQEMQCVFADLPTIPAIELETVIMGDTNAREIKHGKQRTGLLQEASGGTLILRNLDLLPLDVQHRLAIYLSNHNQQVAAGLQQHQNQLINIRLIALTIMSPDSCVKNKTLHPDLVKLFSQHSYLIPPLRQRREDVATMSNHYLSLFGRRYRKRKVKLSVQAQNAIQAYDWPGNVTELKTALERGALLCDSDEITPTHIGLDLADGVQTASQALNLDGYFRYVVLQHQHTLSETDLAARLGISRKALWERRQKMNLPRPQAQ